MSQRSTITDSDQGQKVVNAEGDEIGMISEVENDTAYVNPDSGLTDQIRTKLGWEDSDVDTYALPADSIETVTDDEVRIRSER